MELDILKKVWFVSALCMLLGLIVITSASDEKCKCGQKNPNRIIGGSETGINEYPMMAGLFTVPRSKLFCGATIITSKHVLTSAHCVRRYRNYEASFCIVVGGHDITQDNKTNATKSYNVEKIATHPKYDAKANINDIAVVTSKKNFELSMYVGPVCLPLKYTWEDFTGQTVTALGWGGTSKTQKLSNTLQEVELSIIPIKSCKSQEAITSDMLCTESGDKDACTNDNGGPLLWQNATSNNLIILGVMSAAKCGSLPSISSRVTSSLSFIKSATPGYKYCETY